VDALPPKVEISASRTKLLVLGILGVGMTVMCGGLAFGFFAADIGAAVIGYVGVIFFGFCTLVALWRLFTAHGIVVTMDAEGFRDRRIADKVIPWSAVRDISTWQSRGTRIMILAIDPEFERQLTLSRVARVAREASRALGADGLGIGTNDLNTDYETLFRTATAFWKANS
jgi:hypothetical protein